MKRLNKKGFTLVELIAVVVVLIIVLLIAMNRIRSVSQKAKQNAARANALSYIKAANTKSVSSKSESLLINNNTYTTTELENAGLNLSGTKPDNGVVIINDYDTVCACLVYGDYVVTKDGSEINVSTSGTCTKESFVCDNFFSPEVAEFNYTGKAQTFSAPKDGKYKVQVWGASGGTARGNGNILGTAAKGGYAEGEIDLEKGDKLYVYVGQQGENAVLDQNLDPTFNGGGGASCDGQNEGNGGEAAGSGGGATDVRLENGEWNNSQSLASRIMVAGGAGGVSWDYVAGYGGGINGGATGNNKNAGATQKTGYLFGVGKTGTGVIDGDGVAGGGGGYWGGLTASGGAGSEVASGGSGYISGHTGCIAIKSKNDTSAKDGCNDGTTDNSCSIHYSGKHFTNTVLTAGSESMPTHDGSSTMIGNEGNGFARISLVGSEDEADVKPAEKNFSEAFNGYQKVEYIQSHGTEHILTKITPDQRYGFRIDFNTSNNLSGSGYGSLFGTRQSSTNREFHVTTYSSPSGTFRYYNQSYSGLLVQNQRMIIEYKNKLYQENDGESYYVGDYTFTAPTPIAIFALNENGSITQKGSLKLYDLYFYKKSEIVAHFVPCYKKSNSEIGLCELVEGKFYANSGTGTFDKGSDIND